MSIRLDPIKNSLAKKVRWCLTDLIFYCQSKNIFIVLWRLKKNPQKNSFKKVFMEFFCMVETYLESNVT